MTVFREHYELVGKGKLLAQRWADMRQTSREAQFAVAKSLGAVGFRPGHRGTMRSLFYKKGTKPPVGLRLRPRQADKDPEYQPSMNTKAGKEIAALLAAAPPVPGWDEFCNEHLNWGGRSPMDLDVIYFAGGVYVKSPKTRFFVKLPRELNDKWKKPEGLLRLVRESDMLRAIEDHNAAAERSKKKKKGKR